MKHISLYWSTTCMAPCVPLSSCYSLNTLQYLFLHSYICISAFSNLTLSALYRAPSLFHFTQAELSSISVCECLYTQGGVHVCVCAQGRDCEKWCVFVCETGVFLFLTISLWESVSQLVQPFHVFLFELQALYCHCAGTKRFDFLVLHEIAAITVNMKSKLTQSTFLLHVITLLVWMIHLCILFQRKTWFVFVILLQK